MRFKPFLAVAAVASLAASPALANPASPLSLSNAPKVRAASPSRNGSNFAHGAILPAILAVAIIAGAVVIAVDDNDKPKSP